MAVNGRFHERYFLILQPHLLRKSSAKFLCAVVVLIALITFSSRAIRSANMENFLQAAVNSPIEITISATSSKDINSGYITASFPTENCGDSFDIEAKDAGVLLSSDMGNVYNSTMGAEPKVEIELANWKAGETRSLQFTIVPCPFEHMLEIHFRISDDVNSTNNQLESAVSALDEEWESVKPVVVQANSIGQQDFGEYEFVRSILIMQP